MAEYIEREALLKDIEEERPENWTDSEAERQAESDFYKYRGIVEIQPTADVVEVKHGYWKRQKGRPEAICSECGREVVYQTIDNKWWFENYCPHCGAKMDLKEGAENAPHK